MKISNYIYPIGKFLLATVVVPTSTFKYWISRCFKRTKKKKWDQDLIDKECYGVSSHFDMETMFTTISSPIMLIGGVCLFTPSLPGFLRLIGGLTLSIGSIGYVCIITLILQTDQTLNFYLDQIDIMQYFNINSKNRACGNTRLHIALLEQDLPLVQSLIKKNVDMSIRNHLGLSSLDIIRAFSNKRYPITRCDNPFYSYSDNQKWAKSEKEGYSLEQNFSLLIKSLLENNKTPLNQLIDSNSIHAMTEPFSITNYPIVRFILSGISFSVFFAYFLPKVYCIHCARHSEILCYEKDASRNQNRDDIERKIKQMYGLTYETISLPIAIHFVIPASACSLVTFIIETCKMSDSRIILAPLVLMNCIIQALSFLNNTTFRDLWDGLKFDMTSFLNINQKNIYGNTLLHMAIHRSDFSMVQRLNNKGANFAILCDANEDLQQASITPLDLVIEKLSFATLHPEHHSSAEISTVDPKIVSFLYPLAARNYSKNREEYMNMLSRIINPDKHKSKFPLDICHLIYSYSQNKINFDYTSNEILQRRIIRNKEIGEALSQSMLLKYHLLSKVKLK